ncbi:MAG TPA: cytochrome c oxidase subunit II [Candidatus Limnocylindrales bacterium]|nr:cytochrome c oxidase subunit II [Candidatus Limnocylindrales bacterium]
MFRALRSFARSPRIRLAALIGFSLLVIAGCAQATNDNPIPGFFPPPAATVQGEDTSGLYDLVFWIVAVIFVLVEGLIIYSVFRYRRKKGDQELPKQTHGYFPLEVAWTVIPIVLVLFVWVVALQVQDKVLAESPDPAVTVDVTGFQWQWTFDYKSLGLSYTGAGADGPTMVVPVGEPVHINEHSNDVIHSFYIRDFLFKRDVVPGRVNSFEFTVKEPGTYSGQCAEFCGLGHHQMFFTIKAVSPTDYQAWVKSEQAKAQATQAPPPSGATVIQLSASNTTAFDESTLTAPANKPFVIAFTNKEATGGPPHDVVIVGPDNKSITGMPLAQPGQTVNYSEPALPAGTYKFFCIVHPNMTGTLTVK